MKYWELIVLISGLIYVMLIARHIRWGWIFGILGCTAQAYVSFKANIFLDAWLNLIYVALGIQGYLYWNKQTDKQVAPLMNIKQWSYCMIGGFIASVAMAMVVAKWGNASPYLDAFTTVFSLIATYLTIKKYSENWLYWVVIDAMLCVMFYRQNLSLNALLYLIYTFVSAYGWWTWRNQLKLQ